MTTLDVKIQAAQIGEETDPLVQHMKEDNLRLQFIQELAAVPPECMDTVALKEQAGIIVEVSKLRFSRW